MHFLATMASSQDLNGTGADDKHGCAGFPLLEDVLTIPVVSFMDEPGQPPEMPSPRSSNSGTRLRKAARSWPPSLPEFPGRKPNSARVGPPDLKRSKRLTGNRSFLIPISLNLLGVIEVTDV